jgi:D-alanine-D-alanine ligase
VERLRVVVAYNDDADLKTHLNEIERIGEEEVGQTAREIAGIVGGEILPVRDVRAAIDQLRRIRPDLVLNLCEGVAGKPRWEMHFALLLEMLRLPFTGCDPIATGICGDKVLTKRLLQVNGISVPRGLKESRVVPPAPHAWIVKPSREDAGIGIEASSVCKTLQEVNARIRYVEETYRQPALVEEFIDGREFNQALFYGRDGIVVLPPGEIIFHGSSPQERIVGWKAKWAEGSAEDRATRNVTPAVVTEGVRRDLTDLCRRAASVLSIGGYSRIDVRQRPSGELCIIDVNPNPDIGKGTGFRKALQAAGIEFPDFLDQLMIAARSKRRA